MAIIKAMVAQKVIDGFKGVIDFYFYMGVPCARAWPKKPSQIRNANVRAQWPVFTTAAKLWREISPELRQAYEQMTVGTNLTAKDMFFRGYISGTLRYYIPVDELEES